MNKSLKKRDVGGIILTVLFAIVCLIYIIPRAEELLEVGHGQAGIDNVLHNDDVPPGNVVIQIAQQPHDAARRGRLAVARDGDEVHVQRAVHPAAEVDEEKRRALEHADQHRPFAAEALRQLVGKLPHAVGDGVLGKKHARNILTRISYQHVEALRICSVDFRKPAQYNTFIGISKEDNSNINH